MMNIFKQMVIGLMYLIWFSANLWMVSQPSYILTSLGVISMIAFIARILVMVQHELPIISAWAKRTGLFGLVLAMIFSGCGCGYKRIEPGHVGIIVHLYGGNKGVDFEPVGVGAQWYNPWMTSIYEYPTYMQTVIWTRSGQEGSPTNEELSFASEGMLITADISLSYHLEADKVPAFFAKFRTDDLRQFTHGFMHNVARDAFNEVAPAYSVEQVYGSKKEEVIGKVRDRVNKEVAQYGVVVEQFGYLGAPRLPDILSTAINAKIEATQRAITRENELREAEAAARKQVATAQGAADAILAVAKAQSEANRLLSASITPALVQYKAIEKWNGVRPTVEGSSTGLLMQLPNS